MELTDDLAIQCSFNPQIKYHISPDSKMSLLYIRGSLWNHLKSISDNFFTDVNQSWSHFLLSIGCLGKF